MGLEAARFMEAVAEAADLQQARKRVAGVEWGRGHLLSTGTPATACVMGLAGLAWDVPVRQLRGRAMLSCLLPSRESPRATWANAPVQTPCPKCGVKPGRRGLFGNAEEAVVHVNDADARSLEEARRLLFEWAAREAAAADQGESRPSWTAAPLADTPSVEAVIAA